MFRRVMSLQNFELFHRLRLLLSLIQAHHSNDCREFQVILMYVVSVAELGDFFFLHHLSSFGIYLFTNATSSYSLVTFFAVIVVLFLKKQN